MAAMIVRVNAIPLRASVMAARNSINLSNAGPEFAGTSMLGGMERTAGFFPLAELQSMVCFMNGLFCLNSACLTWPPLSFPMMTSHPGAVQGPRLLVSGV